MTKHLEEIFHIKELEVSITSKCTLACFDCGFIVPNQPNPSIGDPVEEISQSLENIFKVGVRIKSLAVLGGEPTIDGRLLERSLSRISKIGIADRLEVVTNGLTPRGLSKNSLKYINRLSISVYGLGDLILERYRTWLALAAPHIEIIFRRNEEGWDPWVSGNEVSISQAQAMFEKCWYRRHCTTIERGRIFVCSRIAKLSRDNEGLELKGSTSLDDVINYLNRTVALPSCSTCTPMMGLKQVPAGVQPDNRISRLEERAIKWLDAEICSEKSRS